MFENCNVLLPTDFSAYARHALKYAVALAQEYHGSVHIVHVVDSPPTLFGGVYALEVAQPDLGSLLTAMREHVENQLAQLVENVEEKGARAQYHIATGKPSTEICSLAEKLDCDMVVIATHGRSGFDHLVAGSVCEKVVRCSHVPVLSVKHPEHEYVDENDMSIHLKRVLFPCDFSEFSAQGLPYAASLCRQFGATLVLFHAVEMPTLPPGAVETFKRVLESLYVENNARKRLEEMGTSLRDVLTEVVVKTGLPYRMICETVEEYKIDLVVIPTHGRSGVTHVLFGDVAEKVVRSANCPILMLRPEDHPVCRDTANTAGSGTVS